MNEPKISLIAAVAHNYAIGKDGDLPWKLSADMKWFKEKTVGKPVIFGRKTYESMGALKDRFNIVLTSNSALGEDEDISIAASLEDALEVAKAAIGDGGEIMILGGASVYEEALLVADRFYLTVVHEEPEDADTFFPTLQESHWRVVFHKTHPADEKNSCRHSYFILERFQYGELVDSDEHIPFRFQPVTKQEHDS